MPNNEWEDFPGVEPVDKRLADIDSELCQAIRQRIMTKVAREAQKPEEAAAWAYAWRDLSIADLLARPARIPSALAFSFWVDAQRDPECVLSIFTGIKPVRKGSNGRSGGDDDPGSDDGSAIDDPDARGRALAELLSELDATTPTLPPG